jgi:hypothetical protein
MLLLLTHVAWAKDPVLEASYIGKYDNFKVRSTRELFVNDEGIHEMRAVVKAKFASIKERSSFTLTNGYLLPLHYLYKRSIIGFGSERHLRFDWSDRKVHYTRKDKRSDNRSNPITVGVLDPSLYQLKLQCDAFKGAQTFHYTFAKERKVKTLDFKVSGSASFELNGTRYSAITIDRYLHEDNKSTRVTLIPALGYPIAEIQHRESEDQQYNIRLESYSADSDALSSFCHSIKTETIEIANDQS